MQLQKQFSNRILCFVFRSSILLTVYEYYIKVRNEVTYIIHLILDTKFCFTLEELVIYSVLLLYSQCSLTSENKNSMVAKMLIESFELFEIDTMYEYV